MTCITWWLQLKECTALENHELIRDMISDWATDMVPVAHNEEIIWTGETVMPTKISLQGTGMPPDVDELLRPLQKHLEDREYLLFIMVADRDTYDSVGVRYHILTKRIVAAVSGDELAERAKRLVMASEEEILASGQEPLDETG